MVVVREVKKICDEEGRGDGGGEFKRGIAGVVVEEGKMVVLDLKMQ